MKKMLILFGMLFVISALITWTYVNQTPTPENTPLIPTQLIEKPAPTPTPPPTGEPIKSSPTGESVIPKSLLLEVPFTTQAPLAEWSDPLQQDGCEEASTLMAVMWARNQKLENNQAYKEKIIEVSHWEQSEYGIAKDTSAEDTVERIFQGYFKHAKVETKTITKYQEIIDALARGSLVIVPANGQKVGNPHYVQPGPERHMIVVKGYDLEKAEFITNDPGTRSGEGYRYDFQKLYSAIHDYPTGDHQPIVSKSKIIIIVGK